MIQQAERFGGKASSDGAIGCRTQIIDIGVPTARVMRELFATLPQDVLRFGATCINPFDPNLLGELDGIVADPEGVELACLSFEPHVGAGDERR